MLFFVGLPQKSPPRRDSGRGPGRAWWWAVWIALGLGLIVIGHGCHSGDHDIDDEPGIVVHQKKEQ